jgi:hypothetical protein
MTGRRSIEAAASDNTPSNGLLLKASGVRRSMSMKKS